MVRLDHLVIGKPSLFILLIVCPNVNMKEVGVGLFYNMFCTFFSVFVYKLFKTGIV